MLTDEKQRNPRLAQAVSHAEMLAWSMDGKPFCACCGKMTKRVVRDHNHETMVWRGDVCSSCNTIIGYAEWIYKNPEKFDMVRRYLKEYDPEHGLLGAVDW